MPFINKKEPAFTIEDFPFHCVRQNQGDWTHCRLSQMSQNFYYGVKQSVPFSEPTVMTQSFVDPTNPKNPVRPSEAFSIAWVAIHWS